MIIERLNNNFIELELFNKVRWAYVINIYDVQAITKYDYRDRLSVLELLNKDTCKYKLIIELNNSIITLTNTEITEIEFEEIYNYFKNLLINR